MDAAPKEQPSAAPKEQPSGSKTIFVGNLSFSADQTDVLVQHALTSLIHLVYFFSRCWHKTCCISEKFFKAAGEIVDVRLAMRSDISFKCFGHVEFTTTEGAMKVSLHVIHRQMLLNNSFFLTLSFGCASISGFETMDFKSINFKFLELLRWTNSIRFEMHSISSFFYIQWGWRLPI